MPKHPSSEMRRHRELGGALAPGVVLGPAAVARELVPIYGLLRGRVRAKLSAGTATVAFDYPMPDGEGRFEDDGTRLHSTAAPTDLALSDTNEAYRDVDALYGEAYLLVTVTAGGGGCTIEHITPSFL